MLAVLVLFFLGLIFVWRVTLKPWDITSAGPYIVSALRDPVTGNYARFGKVILFWPKLTGPLYLELQNSELVSKNGDVIVSVQGAAISFSRLGLLAGRVMPKEIVLKSPTFKVDRHKDNSFKMALGQAVSGKVQEQQYALSYRIFENLAKPGRNYISGSTLGFLQSLKIENARLLIDDQIIQQTWSLPDFNAGFETTSDGLSGYARLNLPNVGLEQSKLFAGMTYDWETKKTNVAFKLQSVDVKSIIGRIPELGILGNQNIVFSANMETILDEDFLPSDVRLDIQSHEGQIVHPDFSETPVPYKNLLVKGTYNHAGKTLILKNTEITLRDTKFEFEADIQHEESRISGPVKVSTKNLPQQNIAGLWPVILEDDDSKRWIVDKMSNGTFDEIAVEFNLLAEKTHSSTMVEQIYGPVAPSGKPEWRAGFENVKAGFSFQNMDLDYKQPLDPVKNAYGSGSFDLTRDTLKVDLEKGSLGVIPITKAHIELYEVAKEGAGDANLNVDLDGNIQDMLKYLSADPINIDDDLTIDINQVQGTGTLNVSLKFPTLKDVTLEQFVIDVDGTLNDILFPDVIQTLDLSGGPLNFSIHDNLAKLDGKALLDKRPIEMKWEQFLESDGKPYKEKIWAKMDVDPNIREKLGIDLTDFLEGSASVEGTYTEFQDKTGKAQASVDLTPAIFFVDALNFNKAVGEKGSATFNADFKDGDVTKIYDLTGEGKGFKVGKSTLLFKTVKNETSLSRGDFPSFTLGESEGKAQFVYENPELLNIVVKADFYDGQFFMRNDKKDEPYDNPAMKISVVADKIRTDTDAIINDATLYFDVDNEGKFNQVEVDANVGEGKLVVRYQPEEDGRRTFRLKADDAGGFLKAFQVYDDMKGGTMVIYGEPVEGALDRNLKGKAEIYDFRLVREPFLAKILSILSLAGIGEALSGDGLKFSRFETEFEWFYRQAGSKLVLKDGRTSGNSIGLLFEGKFDNETDKIDVSGTVVPMSGLNKVIGKIPLIGDILTGGSGGVFAATYSIKGDSEDPSITVNPLSVLAPGIIRRILFENN
ncbi:MAG: hypothetical protein GC137_00985 [Alphaproteobacteria bacterium]|nr:hypothetical protein [Alphaproteobacteria bacterium]